MVKNSCAKPLVTMQHGMGGSRGGNGPPVQSPPTQEKIGGDAPSPLTKERKYCFFTKKIMQTFKATVNFVHINKSEHNRTSACIYKYLQAILQSLSLAHVLQQTMFCPIANELFCKLTIQL